MVNEFMNYLGLEPTDKPQDLPSPNILQCPSDRPFCNWAHVSYVANYELNRPGIGRLPGAKYVKLSNPSKVLVVCDSDSDGTWIINDGCQDRFADRHSGGGNILFADWHVEWRKSLSGISWY